MEWRTDPEEGEELRRGEESVVCFCMIVLIYTYVPSFVHRSDSEDVGSTPRLPCEHIEAIQKLHTFIDP